MIRVKNLVKSYGESKVLDGISFDVNPGEFIAIFGSSGTGKTTLLNILATFDKPDGGEVFFERSNIIDAPERIMEEIKLKKIGFAHQSNHMIEFLTLCENIALPLILAGTPEKERGQAVARMLKEVGLKEMAGNKPSQLSLGERKRACIARALINRPEVVLIDEPTANLDLANREKISALLSKKLEEGTTIVAATHDQLINKNATKVFELIYGKLVPLD